MSEEMADAALKGPAVRGRSMILARLVVAAVFLLGLGLRLVNLTNPPLDFNPLRQLHSAVVARGMYYEMNPAADADLRQKAIAMWHAEDVYEPTLNERFIALLYLITGGERLWIPRLAEIGYWLVGGLALFDLASRLTSLSGGIVSLAFYLVLPFGVTASRSFQPEPLMVMWLVLAANWIVRWQETRAWKWAILGAVAAGLAAVFKPWAGLFLGFLCVGLVLAEVGIRSAVRNVQVWLMALLMMLIPALYYVGTIQGRSTGYFSYWTLGMSFLITQPSFYVKWVNHLRSLMDFTVLVAALAGALLLPRRGRVICLSLWLGYVVFGLLMPFQIYTHDYYSLILVPVVALSLAPLGDLVARRLASQAWVARVLAIGVMLFAVAYPAWIARSALAGQNFRFEPIAWNKMAQALPAGSQVIALTTNAGYNLEYFGWHPVHLWPYSTDIDLSALRGSNLEANFDAFFKQKTAGMDLFLVTDFGQLNAQTNLKDKLTKEYPVVGQGDGYILYDLRYTR